MKKNTPYFFFRILFLFFCSSYLKAQTTSLISPANNFIHSTDSIFFSWNSVNNASYYELNVAEDAAFTINNKLCKVYHSTDTILKNVGYCKTFFWRVRAYTPAVNAYSVVSSFSVFTPACIPGLEIWMDASSGVIVNGSSEISLWKDKSGKNKNAVQLIAGNQPVLIKETVPTSNRSSFVRLDGTDDFLNVDSSAAIGSVFSVFKWRGSLPNFSGYNTVFMSKVAGIKALILVANSGSPNYYIDGAFNTFKPVEFEVNGVNTLSMAPLDRLKMVNGIVGAAPVNFPNFYIGKYPNDGTAYWNGDIGDIIVYGTALTVPQKISIQNYLNDKYAPPVNLGPDKTVCGFPVIIKAKKDYYTSYLWKDASTADSLIVNAPGTYFVTATNVFGKTSTDTINIDQNATSFSVKLGSDICSDKAVALNAGPDYYTYTWSTGATTNKITAATTGTYSVTVTDCLGNSSKDTIEVTVHPLPSFNLGPDGTLCYYAKDTLDPGFANSQNYTFLWSDSSTDSTLIVNHPGTYSLVVKDNKGCFFKDTVKITVDSSLYLVSLGADFSTCSGNYIYLKTGAAAVTSYLWSDASTNDSLKIMNTGQYFVRVSNAGTCFKNDTINITVFGMAPVAAFTAANVCGGETTLFTDQSVPPAGEVITQWSWDFGDATSSTLTNPTHTYADTGAYVVKLTVKTLAGCEASISKQTRVFPKPDADFSQSPATCDNSSTQFSGTALSFGYLITQWKWNFADPLSGANNLSGVQNPIHHFSGAGNYAVQLIVINSHGCTDTIIKTIIPPLPQTHPQAILPADKYGAAGSDVSFSWSAICGNNYYELNIADDINFLSNNKIYKVYTTDTIIKNFTSCKTYYWRVRAFAPLVTSYSITFSFTTFSPACIPGLEIWMDASSGVIVNGSNEISLWKDRSGKNKNAVQLTAGNQPVLIKETAPTSNKSSFVRLDGTDDFLNVDSSAAIGSVFSVFKWRGSLPNFSGYNTVFMSKVAGIKALILVGNSGSPNYYIDGAFNTFKPVEFEVNGVNTLNMAPLDRLKMVNGIVGSAPVSFPDFYIGKYPNDVTAYWNGDIGDIIVYGTALTTPQKISIQDYLNDKYAPAVNLGPDKTVCGFPVTIKAKKDYFTNYLWQNASTADSLIVNAPGSYYVTTTNVFGRNSSDTIVIHQNGISYTVKLGADICSDKAVALNAGPDYYTYTWSTGATTNKITAATTGTYSVTVTDCLGNSSKDTIEVTVHPLPSFNLGPDGTLCYYAKDTLDPGFANSQNYTFLWSDSSTDSTLIVNHPGTYSLVVKDNKGCFFKDTVKITVDSSLYLASLGADFSTCSGNYIYLKTGAAAVTSYLWSDASTNDSLKIMNTGQYFVRVSNAGTCFKNDTINITVFGTAPVAAFTAANVCGGETTLFTDQSVPPAGEVITQWSWDFGDATSSTLTNPTHTYADTGAYVVKLTVKTLAGCEASISKQTRVFPKPDADFSQSPATCDNSVTQFFGTALSFGYPITQWKWNFADLLSGASNFSTLQNPVHHFSNTANYAVQLIVINSHGCTDTIIKNSSSSLPQTHPQAILPADKFSAAASAVLFSWSAICGNSYYELNIADDINFLSNSKVYKVYAADTIIKNFASCKAYYWRVHAFAPLATPYAATSSFTTFSPDCLPGLELWMDASSGIVKNNSDFVSLWTDKSSNKKSATQLVTAAQPLFYKETAATSNGSSFVRFDGTNDFFNLDTNARIGSVFSVFKWRGSLPNFSGYNTIFMSKTVVPKGLILAGLGGTPNYYVDNLLNTFTPAEFEVNGVNTLSMAPLDRLKMVNGITAAPLSFQNFYIGKYPKDTTAFWNGDIGDIIVFGNSLTTPQKISIQNYLNDKYAPAVNLGPDMTVCGFPVTIKAKKDYFTNYLWQNASTADSLIVNAPGSYYVTTTNVFGRNSSDTILVKQSTSGYVVNLGRNDTAICAGQTVRLDAGPPYLTYLWSNGSTSNIIEASAAGTYTVEVKDCLGNISRDTLNLTLHPLPVFSFGKDTLLCNGMNYQLDPGFVNSKNLVFNWFDNTHDSVHIANYTGTYFLNVKNQYGCSFADTVKVGIDSLIQLATLGPDTSFCAGNFIYLKNGASKAVNYLWSTGSTNDSIAVTLSGTYWVTVKSVNNCSTSDTVVLNVAGIAPTSNFSYTLACLDKSISFTDLSVAVPGKTITSWNWNFGDSYTSTLQNPTHKFTDTAGYVVKLTVTMDDGCAAPFAKIVKVHPVPKPAIVVTNSCEQSAAQFTSSVVTFGYPVMQWNWNFGEPSSGAANVSALKSPVHKYTIAGTYQVRLIATNSLGCIDTVIKAVVVNPLPVADFTSSIACKFNNVLFTDQTALPSGNTIQSSYWNFGDNVTSALINPVHAYLANVNFNVLHAVTASNGCKDTVKKTITVYPTPTAYFSQSKICQDTITNFNDISVVSNGIIANWKWKFNGIDSAVVKNPGYTFTKTGNATVVLIVTTDKGCRDTVQKTIVVNAKPLANFTYTPTYGNPKLTVNFTNTTTGNGLSYWWNFDDGNTSILTNPVHIYADTGIYKPLLTAKNSIGCSDTARGVVTILKRRMDVAMGDIVATLQNGFLDLTGQVTNKGTADVLTMDVYIKIAGGASIKESWTGRLLKGATVVNTFKTSIQMDNLDHFICITLANPNGFADEYPKDNERCEALDVSEFKVLEPYPNPVADVMTLPIVAPEAGNMNITLYNAQGQLIRNVYSGVVLKGLQLISLETRDLNSGLYTCKIEYVDYVIVKKIIKK